MSETEKAKDIFWLNQPQILYKNNNYLNFIPNQSMTKVEQYNAITRFCIILLLILLLFTTNETIILIPVAIIIVVIILYNISKPSIPLIQIDKYTNNNDTKNILAGIYKDMENKRKNEYFESINKYQRQKDLGKYLREKHKLSKMKYYGVGNIENNNLSQYNNSRFDSLSLTGSSIDLSVPNMTGVQQKLPSCVRPIDNNPFSNPAAENIDQNTAYVPVACNADDAEINEQINPYFNNDLYRNIDDLFEKKNSERNFYSVPNVGIPSNQTEFAEWLWGNNANCKVKQEMCLRYEDLRMKDRIFNPK
ncbi:MAG: hypothetical protein Edafosvirus32_4 [Edafosvirus sp.]|uniref:Minor capsid protein P9 transmembrane helices domain-containing protein n=1 Tax=Edafosvirus sp. TaxID=2487765 RepID=A0A3G4ZYW5_9VIRU|nr:MAG: hypothetical protein Edafosvirus32_4 [Edafosvirus sp.]